MATVTPTHLALYLHPCAHSHTHTPARAHTLRDYGAISMTDPPSAPPTASRGGWEPQPRLHMNVIIRLRCLVITQERAQASALSFHTPPLHY